MVWFQSLPLVRQPMAWCGSKAFPLRGRWHGAAVPDEVEKGECRSLAIKPSPLKGSHAWGDHNAFPLRGRWPRAARPDEVESEALSLLLASDLGRLPSNHLIRQPAADSFPSRGSQGPMYS